MDLKKVKELVASLPTMFEIGVELWAAPPRARGLKLRVDQNLTRQHRSEAYKTPCKVIYIEYDGRDSPDKIWIDLETRRIDHRLSTSLLSAPAHLDDPIFVSIVAPVTFPLSPLLAYNLGYRLIEKRRGMDRHCMVILDALKGQLDAPTEALLVEAMQNSWKFKLEQARKRKMGLE